MVAVHLDSVEFRESIYTLYLSWHSNSNSNFPVTASARSLSFASEPFPIGRLAEMADKPSRALVIFGDGLARFVDQSHTHLHALASLASCGFLSLPNAPPSGSITASRLLMLFILFSFLLSLY
ncbi:hypothetical protein SDJN03_08073, partial [Cucurbita argyrosperma subsp. sororia]